MSPYSILTELKKSKKMLIAFFLSIFGIILRFHQLAARNLWKDEIFQLNDTLGPFRPPWVRTTLGELTAFPGDYLLTRPFVQVFGPNKWTMAIPHIIATVIGFWLLYIICNRYLKTSWGYAAAFAAMSLNINLAYHALEFRPYAVLPALALACFYFSERIVYHGDKLSRIKKSFIGLLFVLTTGFHAVGILIVFFCLFFFVLCSLSEKSLKETLEPVLPFLIIAGLLSILVFLWYATSEYTFDLAYSRAHNIYTFKYIPNPVLDTTGFIKSIVGNLIGFKPAYVLLLGIIASLFIPHKERLKQWGFLLVLVIIPLQLICIADMHKQYFFIQRQFVWIMPLFAFFLGWCLDTAVVYLSNKYLRHN